MIETTYKGWHILYNGDALPHDLLDDIIRKSLQRWILKELKNNARSRVLLIEHKGQKAILKSPREKNTRRWIRFTTLYRKAEAFKAFSNMHKLRRLGIRTNTPLMVMEKRKLGMVVDSWLLYEFMAGEPCQEIHYTGVVDALKSLHSKNLLHGDAQLENFLVNQEGIFVIDAKPKKPLFGNIAKYYEWLYLLRSETEIEKFLDLPTRDRSFRIAKIYSHIYWKWRRRKYKRRQKKKKKMNILIIRLSSIGDVILTTPVLDAIKKKYPDAKIHFMVMDRFQDAISGNPNIDKLILFERERYKGLSGIIRFVLSLEQRRYDLVIDLHAKIRSIIISLLIHGRVLRYKKRSLWKSILVPLRLSRYHVDDTIVRNYFKPLSKLHVYFTEESLNFYFDELARQKVRPYQNCVVMAPGAARNTKQWPVEYFAELGKLLNQKIVLVGAAEDFTNFEQIRKQIGPACENLAGKLSLKASGALMADAKYVISNDSGPFHMARAVSTKAFVIFGPTDPGMFDYDQDAVLIYQNVPCSPCSLHGDSQCPQGHFDCMLKLTPQRVYKIIMNELKT